MVKGKIINWRRDTDGRVLSLLCDLGGSKFNLVNIYAPAVLTDRNVFFESLHQYFIPADYIILGGEFNCYENHLDKFGGNVTIAIIFSILGRILISLIFGGKKHPRVREMSWFNSNFTIGSHLDKFFVSSNLTRFVTQCELSPHCLSDHDFVDLHINTANFILSRPGTWKFNNSLLSDSAFCDFASERILDLSLCIDSCDSVKIWWDFFKESLKCEIIASTKHKWKELARERAFLTNGLIILKQSLVQGDALASALIASRERVSCKHSFCKI